MSFAVQMILADAVLVPRPARSCEVVRVSVFYERYWWRCGIEGTHGGIKRCTNIDLELTQHKLYKP
jgi:hypothetical protein